MKKEGKGGKEGGREREGGGREERRELLPCQLLSRGCLEHTSPSILLSSKMTH